MGVSLRLTKPVTNEFGCQIAYIEQGYDKNVENKLDCNADEAIISR